MLRPFLRATRARSAARARAAMGVEIVNTDISGQVLRDRDLLTGDSPLAANALGKLAAQTLLKEVTA